MVTQLVEWLLPTPEIRGSNPKTGKALSTNCNLNRKDENEEKEAGNGPSLKKSNLDIRFVIQVRKGTKLCRLQDSNSGPLDP